MGSAYTNNGGAICDSPRCRCSRIFFILLFSLMLPCGTGEAASGTTPDISLVQNHLKKVFYTLRPDLRNKGLELEGVGGKLDEKTGKWLQIWGEFRGPAASDGKRVCFRLMYRLSAGWPTNLRLSEGVLRGRVKMLKTSPVHYRTDVLPLFPSNAK